jgi:hypothetical protein
MAATVRGAVRELRSRGAAEPQAIRSSAISARRLHRDTTELAEHARGGKTLAHLQTLASLLVEFGPAGASNRARSAR